MRCRFCKQEVDQPCHTLQEMQQRPSSHIDRCERARKRQLRMGLGASPKNIQGRH